MDIRLKIAFIGAAVGILGAVGILFVPAEPFKGFIVVAITWGAMMGLLHSTIIFLAKGGWSSMDAPYVVPTGIISGLALGSVVRKLRSSAS